MGTIDRWEEPTQPEPAISMYDLVIGGEIEAAVDGAIALLDEPTEPGDGYPFLAAGDLERHPATK